MPGKTCTVPDCTGRYYGRGWCKKHYERQRIRGTLEPDPTGRGIKIESDECGVEGCTRPRHQQRKTRSRYCGAHLSRQRKFGDLRADIPIGGFAAPRAGDNPNWRGEAVSYGGAHRRVTRMRGAARLHRCVDCGGQAYQWSYDHEDPQELLGATSRGHIFPYSADVSHYDPRCTACHKAFDLAPSPRPDVATI